MKKFSPEQLTIIAMAAAIAVLTFTTSLLVRRHNALHNSYRELVVRNEGLEAVLKGASQRIAQEQLMAVKVMMLAPESSWREGYDEYINSGEWLEDSRACGAELYKVLKSQLEAGYRK